jgi:hypothetical protein
MYSSLFLQYDIVSLCSLHLSYSMFLVHFLGMSMNHVISKIFMAVKCVNLLFFLLNCHYNTINSSM